jgi:hypothetical protein
MTASHTLCGECGSTLLICSRESCAKPFPRRLHEDETSWGVRRYCSLECASAERQLVRFRDRVLAEKPCQGPLCDKLARQRRNESPASFAERKYCSAACGHAARRQGPISQKEARKQRERSKPVRRDPVPEPKKPLIREVRPVPMPAPAPNVWRPAAWRAMENARG